MSQNKNDKLWRTRSEFEMFVHLLQQAPIASRKYENALKKRNQKNNFHCFISEMSRFYPQCKSSSFIVSKHLTHQKRRFRVVDGHFYCR